MTQTPHTTTPTPPDLTMQPPGSSNQFSVLDLDHHKLAELVHQFVALIPNLPLVRS